jgi:uncharacterized zinc-type alcohol dehydrogenase-like protein
VPRVPDPHLRRTDRHDHTTTQGGYSTEYVVRDRFSYAVPDGLDPAEVAPLMCAGITVWEPLQRWHVGAGMAVGVVGLGGLGHLAVKFAAALGADVTTFTTTAEKSREATRLGASRVVVSTSADAMTAERGRYDFILDTASGPHDLTPYLNTLRLDGTLCTVGMNGPPQFDPLALLIGKKSLSSAGSGGIPSAAAVTRARPARSEAQAGRRRAPDGRPASGTRRLIRIARSDLRVRPARRVHGPPRALAHHQRGLPLRRT